MLASDFFSVRMRASDRRGRHISGAEGIADSMSVNKLVRQYVERALLHPRGEPADVQIKVERIRRKPLNVQILSVRTLRCSNTSKADSAIRETLAEEGVSKRAINAGLKIIRGKRVMRGASIVDAVTGRRLEPDRIRGVRATLMGILPEAMRSTRKKLGRMGIDTITVLEALVLASKASSAPGVVAELCASDDPDYTTGYMASKGLGYLRVTNIKPAGSMSGGRVFFIQPGCRIESLIKYLQQTPVLVG